MSGKGIQVIAEDLENGDLGEVVIQPGEYVLIPAEPLYLDSKVVHPNGTIQLTLKRRMS